MKKSDLRSGMVVTTRDRGNYCVMLNTGLCENDIIFQRLGNCLGWMPLSQYDDDLLYHHEPDFMNEYHDLNNDRAWDIMSVSAVGQDEMTWLCMSGHYRMIWTREE